MSRQRRCQNFLWHDEDPAWQAERENDRIVFRKIRREQLRNRKTAKIIRGLFLSPLCIPAVLNLDKRFTARRIICGLPPLTALSGNLFLIL